ncbi:MAG: hypothetical protein K0Q49_1243 [Haloplasmataceae bacterium]|nr:hypothetical protein [Haloplasmataceae bacterium]
MDCLYLSFMNQFLKEKEYIIILCLKDLSKLNDDIDQLYEIGIISLYYIYKFYNNSYLDVENFDYIAYNFVLSNLLEYIKNKV